MNNTPAPRSGLVDAKGKPLTSVAFKKADPPKTGNAFAPWAGRENESIGNMPGGSLVQFDLTKLQTEDFRVMRDHYQVNASLAVLSFLQHQAEWSIECEDKKIAAACEAQLRDIWTALNRSLGTANWAGYSPNALDWENLLDPSRVAVTKVKDLRPEECEVNWKLEEGWAPPNRVRPKYKVYDGIKYAPQPGWPIPVENSFWYPLLMENGDYYGRKLLRPAFQSWFFSILVHLFANRYFERFGEPVPIGRAPFDDEIEIANGPNGQPTSMKGDAYLLKVLQDLRNRSVVVLPNDRTQTGNQGQSTFDYEIEYLESQMRGADFERYLTRLDEEISIGLFTPILLLRTADVGSYNLGQGHLQVYQWMMNAINDDRATYINQYLLSKYVDYNFSPRAPRAKIVFHKKGNTDNDLIKQVMVALISGGTAKPDLDELGLLAGLSLKQVRQTTAPDPAPDPADPAPGTGTAGGDAAASSTPEAHATVTEIRSRVAQQVSHAFKNNAFNSDLRINMGFKRRMQKSLETDGVTNAERATEEFFGYMDHWLADIVSIGQDEFSNSGSFMEMFDRVAAYRLEKIGNAANRT